MEASERLRWSALIVSDLPERMAPPEPDSPARRLTVPCGISGCISAEGEVDRYPFHAVKGKAHVFEIEARRCGSALDVAIRISAWFFSFALIKAI